MSEKELVTIGKIVDPHGVKGQVKLLPLTDFPDRFNSMKEISLYEEDSFVGKFKLLKTGQLVSQGLLILTLEGLADRNQAEALKGCVVKVPPHERVPLPEGQYWISDIIGFKVQDEEGNQLGTLTDVFPTGASDLMLISDLSGKEHYVPMVDQFLVGVSLERKQITIRLLEGLWD